ncbi:hypothetical protein N7451_001412 [Penicillium sp. IBT 35674x]|nr:hypothetical protein N7451_001412 [Penicillium sp. IBT 35674x]
MVVSTTPEHLDLNDSITISRILITLKVAPDLQHCNAASFQPSATLLGPSKSGQGSKVAWNKPIYPTAINPSRAEVNSGRLKPRNLEVAIRSLFHDGLIVVTDVVSHNILDQLNKDMVDDAQKLYSQKGNSPFNYNPNNLQRDAPPTK